jgi:hypothetical protein
MLRSLIKKEWRIIAPVAAAIICVHLLAYAELLLNADRRWSDMCAFLLMVQWVLFHILAVLPFGMEFQSGSMERILSQPMSRKRIWWKKVKPMLVFFVLIVPFNTLLLSVVGVFAGAKIKYELFDYSLLMNGYYLLAAIVATGGGLCMSIYARRLLVALVAALLLPMLIYSVLVGSYSVSYYLGWIAYNIGPSTYKMVFTFLVVLAMIYAATTYTLAYRRFMRLEV